VDRYQLDGSYQISFLCNGLSINMRAVFFTIKAVVILHFVVLWAKAHRSGGVLHFIPRPKGRGNKL
jgi:hypothetical protein